MKILLVGNYPYLKSQSMDRFAAMLYNGLKETGHEALLLKPTPLFGHLTPSPTGLGKWLGYIDRFLLFRPRLRRAVDWADIIHICDQANSIYVQWLKHKPHLVTCHDMLAIRSAFGEFPDNLPNLTGQIYQRWILSGLNRAMHVVCVSETTKEDMLRFTKHKYVNVSVIKNGLNYPYRKMAKHDFIKHLNTLGVSNYIPFFLHVGNNNWYKNRRGLLKIFSYISHIDKNNDWNLVLAGKPMCKSLKQLAIELNVYSRIKETINITNEQLCALYSAAQGLIFPSIAEGFGWPIIEAQACGCPVYTTGRKPMTEIGGSGAVYFNIDDEFDSAKTIINSMGEKKEFMSINGHSNALQFSTNKMLSSYEEIYKRLLINAPFYLSYSNR